MDSLASSFLPQLIQYATSPELTSNQNNIHYRSGEISLKGQVALVTGASRGVGRGIVLQLGQAGATVFITGRPAIKKKKSAEKDVDLPAQLPTLGQVADEVW